MLYLTIKVKLGEKIFSVAFWQCLSLFSFSTLDQKFLRGMGWFVIIINIIVFIIQSRVLYQQCTLNIFHWDDKISKPLTKYNPKKAKERETNKKQDRGEVDMNETVKFFL